ncbi:MAG: MipA/OmpV family protein [Candidatus Omnitrophica bacterium]|nr:MipA/OmpV family protein [Candidatus Omnitrophota bacterium]
MARSYIFMLCVALLMTTAACAEESMTLAGAGAVVSTRPYRGVGSKIMAVPLMSVEYKNLYIKGVEAGYSFYKTGLVTVSVITSPRLLGYSSEDSLALNGMEDRRMSWDAGLKAALALPWEGATAHVKLLNDILSRYDGREVEAGLSKVFKGSFFQLTPGAGARWQSRQLLNYYYGVNSGEVRANRPEYHPGSGVEYFTNVLFNFGITPNWIVVTRAEVDILSHEVTDSPIVSRHYGLSGVLGLTRKF